MIQIQAPDRRALLEPRVTYMNSKGAGIAASRKLGRDWRERGYRIEEARPWG